MPYEIIFGTQAHRKKDCFHFNKKVTLKSGCMKKLHKNYMYKNHHTRAYINFNYLNIKKLSKSICVKCYM